MNKKGFIRTLEAVIAIVILLGLVLFMFDDQTEEIKKRPEVVESANKFITNEFLHDINFRNCFLNTQNEGKCSEKLGFDCKTKVESFLSASVPPGYSYHCEICEAARSCTTFPFPEDKSIYPKSVFLYLFGNQDKAKVVRIYLFESA